MRVSESTPEDDLDTLITDWLDWKAAATQLHVTVSKVRTLIREHQLAAAVPTPSPAGVPSES